MTSKIFKPTYLYIKQHAVTGKLYFGKTTKSNPETYLGSGKHWKSHIKVHGNQFVITRWFCLFIDQESCTEFALNFSKQQNIVESSNWLNLKPENGLDGAITGHTFQLGKNNSMYGKIHTLTTKLLCGKANIGRIISEYQILKIKEANSHPKSNETKRKMSDSRQHLTIDCTFSLLQLGNVFNTIM